MYLTPKEARQKICPLLWQGMMAAHPSKEYDGQDARCWVEHCMMWRVIGSFDGTKGYCALRSKS